MDRRDEHIGPRRERERPKESVRFERETGESQVKEERRRDKEKKQERMFTPSSAVP